MFEYFDGDETTGYRKPTFHEHEPFRFFMTDMRKSFEWSKRL